MKIIREFGNLLKLQLHGSVGIVYRFEVVKVYKVWQKIFVLHSKMPTFILSVTFVLK